MFSMALPNKMLALFLTHYQLISPAYQLNLLILGTLSFVNSANIFSDYEAAFEIDDMIFVGDPLSGGNLSLIHI